MTSNKWITQRTWFGTLVGIALIALAGCERVEPTKSAEAEKGPKIVKTEGGTEMVLLPGGTFTMGSESGQDDEKPARKVTVDSFLMDRHEVTQAMYDKLVPEGSASHFKGPNRPVEQISWVRAAIFCNLRSKAEGLEPCYDEETGECNFEANGYRLPTEAEWEYACRAGSSSQYTFGDNPQPLTEHAWFAENSGKTTHPVAQKKPNAWGLFDMHGNVAEWCNDPYDADYYASARAENPTGPKEGDKYVLRGGAWNSSPKALRSSYRVAQDPGNYDGCFGGDFIGFRCVRKAPADEPDKTKPAGGAAAAKPAEKGA